MDCAKVQELLSEYLDGLLDSNLDDKIREHLDNCDVCRREYELLNKIINECNNICDEDLPDGFHERICSAISQRAEGDRNERFGWVRKYYKAAAALIVLALSLGFIINSGVLGLGSKKTMTASRSFSTGSMPSVNSSVKSKEASGAVNSESDSTLSAQYTNNADNVVSINLNSDEYKKNIGSIAVSIKSYGGHIVYEEPAMYVMPAVNMDAIVSEFKEKLGSKNITVSNLESEIKELQDKNGTESNLKSLDMKKNELDMLKYNYGCVIIEVNVGD